MTDQQIIDNNKLIAEFDGLPKRTNGNTFYYYKRKSTPCESLHYHDDWNWLIPVVEKIGNTRVESIKFFTVEITNEYTMIKGRVHTIIYNVSIEKSMRAATYKAVVEFIKWYNKKDQSIMKKYIIQVREKYGRDQAFRREQAITNGQSFGFAQAHNKRRKMQKYSNSLIYKVAPE